MNNHQFNRILRLVKRTGDKFVVLDKATDAAQVLMSLDSYEDLLGLDFEDDFDPNDLPSFDNGGDNFKFEEDDDDDDDNDSDANFADWADSGEIPRRSYSDTSLEWGEDDFDSDNRSVSPEAMEEVERMKTVDEERSFTEPSAFEPAGESLADVPHEEEEEKFYLEPVE